MNLSVKGVRRQSVSDLVIDSSALLAAIYDEPGGHKVTKILDVAEVFTKLVETESLSQDLVETFNNLGLEIFDFDQIQASIAADLRPLTKHLGLSLGDRYCLALASHHNAAAVTAGRQ